MIKIIARFCNTGKFQLLSYVGCAIWKVELTFLSDEEALDYSITNKIPIK